jgi:transposase
MAARVRALRTEAFDAPLIAWPQPAPDDDWLSLEDSINEIWHMNPGLELAIVKDVHGITFLQHPGSGLDVVRIDIPRFPDTWASLVTAYNEQHSRVTLTDGRQARVGIRRIERTANGGILARPRSADVHRVFNALGRAFHDAYGWAMLDKCFPGWCVLPGADGAEVWEYEWSYWAAGKDAAFESPERRKLKYRDEWAVLPTGMIAIRDQFDLPRADLEARCAKTVAMGVVWCILMDQEEHDLVVYRPDDVPARRTDIEGWTLPEMPDVIFKQEWIRPKKGAA